MIYVPLKDKWVSSSLMLTFSFPLSRCLLNFDLLQLKTTPLIHLLFFSLIRLIIASVSSRITQRCEKDFISVQSDVISVPRDCLAFCTEPVFASLSNVLGQWDNLPSPVPTDIKEYKLYDVETKYGLLQVRIPLFSFNDLCKTIYNE